MVVAWHVVTVPPLLGAEVPDSLKTPLVALYPYRIPALLFLSGMMLPRSLAKGPRRYAMGKVRNLLWPFVLWTLIMAMIWPDPGRLLDAQTWWRGSFHLWFLGVLGASYLLGPLTRFIPAWLWPVPMVLLSQVAPHMGLVRICWFGAFFFAGAAAARWVAGWQRTPAALPLLLGAVAVGYGITAALTPGLYQIRHVPSFLISLVGLMALVWAAPRLPRLPWLERVGANSIVIYLAHFPVIALGYRALQVAGLESWWVLGPVLLVLGVGVPVLMMRWSGTWLFRMPSRPLSASPCSSPEGPSSSAAGPGPEDPPGCPPRPSARPPSCWAARAAAHPASSGGRAGS